MNSSDLTMSANSSVINKSLRLCWMEILQSEQADYSLIELTIPGTHDTGTWNISPGNSASCQSWSLKTQLEHGVRFVDIRLVPEWNSSIGKNDLAVYHAHVPGNVWFSDIVETCRTFLSSNKKETIIMSIKNENNVSDADFIAALDPFLDTETQKNSTDLLFYTQSTVPKLSECSGQIVLFRRYKGSLKGIDATPAVGWPGDAATTSPTTGSVPMMIQDKYTMRLDEITEKWNDYVLPFLQGAEASASNPLNWWINFTSASGFGYPSTYSSDINPLMQEWLQQKIRLQMQKPQRFILGTVIMDFPSPANIDALIATNFNIDDPYLNQVHHYTLRLFNNTAYIGKCYQPGSPGSTWSYAQKYTDGTKSKVAYHSLVKVDGSIVSPFIHFGDTIRILSNEFTNDEYVYLQNYGSKTWLSNEEIGKNVYYDNISGSYEKDASTVEWLIEPGDGSDKVLGDVVELGDVLRLKSLFQRNQKDLYLMAATDSYLCVAPLVLETDNSVMSGGADWVMEW